MRVVCSENVPPHNWDERLYRAINKGGLCQSAFWARVLRQIDRAKPLFLDVYKGDGSDGQGLVLSLLLFHKIPWNRHKNRRNYRSLMSFEWTGWLDWMDGPVCHSDDPVELQIAMNAVLGWVEDYAKRNRVTAIRAQMPPTFCIGNFEHDIRTLFMKYGYRSNGWATYLIDLQQDEDALRKQLSNAAKKCINKALRSDIKVKKINSLEEFKSCYYLPYSEIESSLGKQTNPWSVAVTTWGEDLEGYYSYYIAILPEGETLATLGMYMFNGVATEVASAISPKALEQKIPAQDLLHWEMLLEAKRAGCHTFDLAGVNPTPMNSKEEGIRRFKEKWGGRYVEYNRYEKVFLAGKAAKAVRSLVRYLTIKK